MKRYLTALLLLPLAAFAWQRDWDWHIPSDVYKGLEFSARSGVDRAMTTFSRAWEAERRGTRAFELVPMYRAAADEFRKVQIQAESEGGDESLLAYCVFMQGFSRYKARDRNEAIKLFNETLDLYDDLTWIAFTTRYWIGQAKMDMGDTKTGWKMIEELVDEDAANTHPLMGTVLNRVGWDRWGKFKEQEAQDLWLRGTAGCFWENNRDHAESSRGGLHLACVVRGDWAVFEDSIFGDVKPEAHARRADIVRDNANWVRNELGNGNSGILRYFAGKYPKQSQRDDRLKVFRKTFLAWFESKRPEFEACKRGFEFDCLNVRMHYGYENEAQLMKRIEALVAATDATKDQKVIQGRLDTFIGFYYDFNRFDLALMMADRVKDPQAACWKRYDVCHTAAWRGAKGDWWEQCVRNLDDFLGMHPTDEGQVRRAKYAIGQICRDRIGKADRAVKVFLDLNDPPQSLWELVWSYRKLGEKKKAEMVLIEIASMFKDHAAQAVWTQAQYCEQDGEKKKAIALYRRLLTQPEWKTTSQSSQAHQALERLGERTGGAMTNEVR